jgi:hypothetical protein
VIAASPSPPSMHCPGGTEGLAVVWCDAHADMHTPRDLAVRCVLGHGAARSARRGERSSSCSPPAIPASRVITVGIRNLDDEEVDQIAPLTNLSVNDLARPEALLDAVRATGASRVWVHIDVDVLDPLRLRRRLVLGALRALPPQRSAPPSAPCAPRCRSQARPSPGSHPALRPMPSTTSVHCCGWSERWRDRQGRLANASR